MPGYWYKKAVPEKDQTTSFPSLFSLLEDMCCEDLEGRPPPS